VSESVPVSLRLKSREVLSRERLDGEVVAIDFESGDYFSFEGPAADIFWLLEAGVAFFHWESIFTSHYANIPGPEHLRHDLLGFLEKLRELGLAVEGSELEGGALPLPLDCERGSWEKPEARAHNELADLLIIDPIHDTGEDGWPEIKSK